MRLLLFATLAVLAIYGQCHLEVEEIGTLDAQSN